MPVVDLQFLKKTLIFIPVVLTTLAWPEISGAKSRYPLSSFTINVPIGSSESFLAATKTFAEDNAFAYRAAPLNESASQVRIEFWRIDFFIFIDNSDDEVDTEYTATIYNTDSEESGVGSHHVEIMKKLKMVLTTVAGVKSVEN
jgi:hypothetical protein